MDPAGPLDNSVFVVAPHNSYPATQEGMCQVALYPSNQPQVHQLPVNPPGLKPSVSEQPVRRALKEGKALGVRELSLCRPGVTGWSQTGRGGGRGGPWKYSNSKSSEQGWSWPSLAKSGPPEISAVQHHQGLGRGPFIFRLRHLKKEEEKQQQQPKKSGKLECWSFFFLFYLN